MKMLPNCFNFLTPIKIILPLFLEIFAELLIIESSLVEAVIITQSAPEELVNE